MKDVLDVNTSNTSSNTSDVLKTGRMYRSVLKDVSDVLFSWQDVLNDVLACIESRQDVSNDVLRGVLKNCRMYCRLYCRSNKDVLDVLRFSRMYCNRPRCIESSAAALGGAAAFLSLRS